MKKLITLALAAFFFGAVQAQESVTFRVDMNQAGSISPNGVHVAGNWQSEANGGDDWQPGANAMDDSDGDGIYELTVTVPAGNYEFKYINGNDWSEQPENVDGACAAFTNRLLTVPAGGVSLDPVCFGSCDPCGIIGGDITLTLQVDASQIDVDPAGIHVGGTFNGFIPQPMNDQGGGIWSLDVIVASGELVLWKYVNGPEFGAGLQENVPSECGMDDGFGGNNRDLIAPDVDTVLDVVCYGSCEACTTPGEFYDLTLQVDVSELMTINEAGIHVAGTFNNFGPEQMTDLGNGVWSYTASVEEGSTVLWKYINGPTFGDEVESVPSACGQDDGFGGFNRVFTMPSENTTLGPVCFSACESCELAPTEYELTLIVDASQLESVFAGGIHVAGTFNGFTPTAMNDDGDGLYSISYMVDEGETVLYKFINNDSFDVQELVEEVPEACGQDDGFGGFNRVLTMPSNDLVQGPVCFSSCEACPEPVPCEAPYPQVDGLTFSNENGGVVLSWNPILGSIGCQVQAGTSQANAVTITVFEDDASSLFINGNNLQNGLTYSWRVRCGCSTNPLVVGPYSGISQFTYLNFGKSASSETTLRAVPNPSNGQTFVTLNTDNEIDRAMVEVYDLSGRLVEQLYSGNVPANQEMRLEFDGSDLPEGIYLIRFTTNSEVKTEKFMISR